MTCNRLERDDLLGHLGEDMPHVHECPDCRAKLAGYNRLADLLAGESVRPLPHRWKERTLARIHRRGPRRRLTVGLVAAGAVAAVVVVILLRPRPEPELVISLARGPVQWRADAQPGQAQPGDVLHASMRADAAHLELRVYLEARDVVVRCPARSPRPAAVETGSS